MYDALFGCSGWWSGGPGATKYGSPDTAFAATASASSSSSNNNASATETDHALEMLRKKITEVEEQITYWRDKEWPKLNAEMVRLGRESRKEPSKKSAALLALARRKDLENRMEKHAAILTNLMQRMNLLNETRDTAEIAKLMKSTGTALQKAKTEGVSIEEVQETMDEQRDHTDNLAAVQNVLAKPMRGSTSKPMAQVDLENELNVFLAADDAAATAPVPLAAYSHTSTHASLVLPSAPATAPSFSPAVLAAGGGGGSSSSSSRLAVPADGASSSLRPPQQPRAGAAPVATAPVTSSYPQRTGGTPPASSGSRIAAGAAPTGTTARPAIPSSRDAFSEWDKKTGV